MLSSKKTTQYLFVAYLFLLSWCILLKFETQLENLAFFQRQQGDQLDSIFATHDCQWRGC